MKNSIGIKKLVFKPLEINSPYTNKIISFIRNRLVEVYGDQEAQITKLLRASDRSCELMLSDGLLLGVIIYKSKLQEEYGLEKAFELKSLFLIDPEINSNKGLGTKLWDRVFKLAKESSAKWVYCTASSKLQEAINCAEKNGMRVMRILSNSPDKGTVYLLASDINLGN